jgi:hypothetical protein
MDNPTKRPSIVKPIVKGVIGAGVATVVTTGAMGVLSLVALPIAVAGAVYAKSQANTKTASQAAKVWGVVAGTGLTVAAAMYSLDMVPTIASLGFALGTGVPFLGNRLLARLSDRRQAQGVLETRPTVQSHNGRQISSGEPTVSDRTPSLPLNTAPNGTVSIDVPVGMADQVARFVETLKTPEVQAPQEEAPRRTQYRPR